ncbi:MAG: type II toxin-antitoxin system RelE/ParE family toxin [Nitrospiraceae bacterium]|nr:type II toxin-antitoxin system RelE/ParE family toxin [Nitrospiraceae bacterium]
MNPYRARYTPEATERIRKLHPEIKREIRDGIRTLLNNPLAGHTLHLELSGYRSYRVRTYRIIYQINDEDTTLDVIFVGPRRNVYEELTALLLEQGY